MDLHRFFCVPNKAEGSEKEAGHFPAKLSIVDNIQAEEIVNKKAPCWAIRIEPTERIQKSSFLPR
jgi:hypothetical protein